MALHQDILVQCLLRSLSHSADEQRLALAQLTEAANRPEYSLSLLRLVADPSVQDHIRQSASINFKNHLKARWSLPPDSPETPIPDADKQQIKTLIVGLMLSSPRLIQSQLGEALAVIGQHDFPKSWPTLLPELISNLRAASQHNEYASVNGILTTANSIFKKFRYQYKSNDLLLDLKYCLDNFAAPLLEVFLRTASLIDSVAGSAPPDVLKTYFESQRLCCRIFFSLNFQELPEFFEDHMKEWMTEFRKYLTTPYPVLEGNEAGREVVDAVRAAVCENISLYMEKNEEEFQGYLNEFAVAVWTLLVNVSQSSSRERLAVTAIKFLTTVSTSVHHALFSGEGIIPQICEGIVIPNVRLNDEDVDLFEMNYGEFIRRDMEGSDVDTRRRIACELLKGIATNYKAQVTNVVSTQIQKLLNSYASNPGANWKDKDCAIYLVLSLATKKAGGTSVSTDLVDVQSFFATVIVPELQSQDTNSFPMLKAGALKFFTMFRNQLPKPLVIQFFPDLVRFLGAESNVVHSYAASCIEKLLLVKDGGQPRFTAVDVSPFLLMLINNLFNALKLPDSQANHYIMKCIMRVLGVAEISSEIAVPCISGLTLILNEVCRNPANPIFNHYLFESVAVLIRRACERDISLIMTFERDLFPILQTILANDVAEFLPYAFQLLAQLVELNRPPLSLVYMQIFMLLLSPDAWRRNSNVPALVRLLQAFLQKAPTEISQGGRLSEVLGIFYKLVSAPGTEEQGFYVLNTVVESLEYGAIAPFMHTIWTALFSRLQNNAKVKFLKSMVIFMSLFLVKHGPQVLVETMNKVQADIFFVILDRFWTPSLKLITGPIEVKLSAVAATKLICESPVLLDATGERCGKMLNSIITLLSRPEEDRVQEEPEMPDIAENVGYTASFVNLYNAGKKEEDPLKDIRDPKEYLVASLSRVSSVSPGRFPSIINAQLDEANKAALLQLCNTYHCAIV